MNAKTITMGIVGITVAVLITMSVAAPILAESIKTEDTFTNEGVFNYALLTDTDTYEFEFDHDVQDGTITVNDESIIVPVTISGSTYSYSIIYDDDWVVRMSYSVNQGGYYCQIVGIDSDGNSVRYTGSITALIEDSLFKVSVDTDYDGNVDYTKSFEINDMYGIVKNPDDAVLKVSTQAVYIKGDTELSVSGLTSIPDWYDIIHFEGTYDDGITITSPNVPDATFDNIQWNIEPVDGYNDLYKLTSIEFDAHYDDTVRHTTYSYFGVPLQVTAERSVHPSATTIEMLEIIPIMVLIGIVLATIGLVMFKRNQ